MNAGSSRIDPWRGLFGLTAIVLLVSILVRTLAPAAGARAMAGLLPEVLLLFAAAPLLRRLAPREPALLKTLLFSALLSPALIGGIWLGLRAVGVGLELVGPLTLAWLLSIQLWGLLGSERGAAPGRDGADTPGLVGRLADAPAQLAALGQRALAGLSLGRRPIGPSAIGWLLPGVLIVWILVAALAPFTGGVASQASLVLVLEAHAVLLTGLVLLVLAGAGRRGGLGRDGAGAEPGAADASPAIGRAPALALAVALGLALAVGFVLFGEAAARTSFHGLLHSSIVEATAAGLPPENPWLAARPLGYYWVWHGLGAALGDLLVLAPTQALALLNVWAAAIVPLALYFLAAPLWREARRDLGAVLLGLFGLNLFGGWLWLANSAPWTEPSGPLELLANLRGLVGDWDARLAWGPSKFGNLSSYPAALALLLGGLVAGGHALRRPSSAPSTNDELELQAASSRAWTLLAALGLGLALLVNPLVGAAGFLAVGPPALLGRRWRLFGALVLAGLPGLVEVLLAGGQRSEGLVELGLSGAGLWGALAPVLPLLLPAAALWVWRPAQLSEPGPAAFERMLWWGALSSLAVAALVVLPEDNQYKFVRTAQLPLAVLAAGGLGQLMTRGRAAERSLGWAWIGTFGLAALAASGLGARSYWVWSSTPMPLAERAGELQPAGGGDLSEAFAWLRPRAAALTTRIGKTGRYQRPVLVAELGQARRPGAGWVYGGQRFGGAFNLQGHEAAAFSGMGLFCDRASYLVEDDPEWAPRLETQALFFAQEPTGARRLAAELERIGRPSFLLTPYGRLPEVLAEVAGLGEVAAFGDVIIYADARALQALGEQP